MKIMLTEGIDKLLQFKKREAAFRRTVRAAHQLFCSCGDPVQHLLGWRTIGGLLHTTDAGTTGEDTAKEDCTEPTDEDMADAIQDAEG
nr:ORF2 [Banfec anellovirus 2]